MNGLPQGSVLSPTFFNLYTNDLPVTGSRKFIYADDICLTKQAQRYAELNAVSHRTWCVWPHTAAFGGLSQAP